MRTQAFAFKNFGTIWYLKGRATAEKEQIMINVEIIFIINCYFDEVLSLDFGTDGHKITFYIYLFVSGINHFYVYWKTTVRKKDEFKYVKLA